jgi:hypothetical protein
MGVPHVPDDALYFPYIEVPSDPSLTRVLLYWDRLATIVPNSIRGSDRLEELIRLDLVESIDPEKYDRPPEGWIASVVEELARQEVDAPVGRVHFSKGSFRLWQRLESVGVAERAADWILLPEPAADFYMAYLATWLGHTLGKVPVTDRRSSIDAFVAEAPVAMRSANRAAMREVALRNILPAPAQSVDPRQIAEFKYDHWELLGSFRRNVERRLLECAREPDDVLRAELVAHTCDELAEEVQEIQARMSRWWPTTRGLITAAIPAGVYLAKFAATGDPWAIAEAAAPVSAEILSTRFASGDVSPIAYAVLAQKRFG